MSSCTIFSALLFSYSMMQYLRISQSLAPNIIFVLTDDQDLQLKSMDAMPNVKADIIDKGITFKNAFATTPVCCPSRTETVAGRQYHNVQGSGIQCQGVAAYDNLYNNPDSLFNKFHANGYLAGGFGKVTNDMTFCDDNNAADLSSFDRLHVSCNYYDFYWTEYFNKYVGDTVGEISQHPQTEDIYQTAMLGNASIDFISQQLQLQENNDVNAKPFIMWIAPYAPHTPAFPATWYQDQFSDIDLVREPNYNCPVSNIYHPPLDNNPEINAEAELTMKLLYRNRLRSLLSVDDMVHEIVQTVDTFTNAWDNTYIIFASDHGYHIGQYRIPCGKSQPYEPTIRIPLYIRGPGVASGQVSDALVSNIDFLPTFLDLAGISYIENTYDGRSIKRLMENGINFNYNDEWRQVLLFEYKTIKGTPTGIGISKCVSWDPDSTLPTDGKEKSVSADNLWTLDNEDNNWRVLRIKNQSVNWMYGEFVNLNWNDEAFATPEFYEFFDLNLDPYQLNNIYTDLPNEQKQMLHGLVMQYGICSGADSCSPIGVSTATSATTSASATTSTSVPITSVSTSTDSTASTSSSISSTSTTSTSTKRTKGAKSGKNNAESVQVANDDNDDDNGDNDGDNNDNNNDFFKLSLSNDGYTEIALILCFGIVACAALGIGILIGKQLEKRPYVVFDHKV